MTETHRFLDEWLAEGFEREHILPAETIASIRADGASWLSERLLKSGALSRADLAEAVRKAFSVPFAAPAPAEVEKMALSLVNEKTCREHRLVPFRLKEDDLHVAMLNPLDVDAINMAEAVSGRRAVPHYCPPEVLESLLVSLFNPEAMVADVLARIDERETVEVLESEPGPEPNLNGRIETPVIRLCDSLITRAVRMRASDVHIEHEEQFSQVRFRVDGVLKNIVTLPKSVAAGPLVSRVKIMADLDIAEHYRPQDGRAKLRIGADEIGLRVSTLPTSYGEKVVLRILDPRAARVELRELGFRPEVSQVFEQIIQAEQGMVLVTGPTGSGKTTTLYSLLNRLKTESTNIVTIEDPIEYRLEGVNQVQVNERQGMHFATALRSVLRQDPDVILVGEIRDRETADIAFQSALTGHLVFSTLHTSDSLAAVTRLVDMGVERFKIAPALLAVASQRLVRRLCPHCRAPVPEAEAGEDLLQAYRERGMEPRLWRAAGCGKCDYLGYRGRIALLELLKTGRSIRDLIASGGSEAALRRTAEESRELLTFLDDALWHLQRGDTTLEEVYPHSALRRATGSDAGAASGRELPRPSGSARRILVTDDDGDIRAIVRKYLEKQGYEVIDAEDGVQALDRIARGAPDLVLVDLQMPRLDGYGVIRGVRQTLGLADLPIIMLTSVSDDKSQEEAINLGADDYIIKPFRPNILVSRINSLFRRLQR